MTAEATKRCNKCKLEKPLSEFYRRLDGFQGHCKTCSKAAVRKWNKDHPELRGLLCGNCNSGIGLLGDSTERLEAALAYLTGEEIRLDE